VPSNSRVPDRMLSGTSTLRITVGLSSTRQTANPRRNVAPETKRQREPGQGRCDVKRLAQLAETGRWAPEPPPRVTKVANSSAHKD
jgi:hypothetical protein